MPDFDDFADSLKVEVLSEMADTFFGARRELDSLLERFDHLTKMLVDLAQEVKRRAGLVHVLLLEKTGSDGFYRAIGVDPDVIPFPADKGPVSPVAGLPFALTGRGGWLKLLKRAYAAYQAQAHDYMNGHPEADPREPKRKRISLHYGQLAVLAERINDRIRYVNEDLSMREVLEYTKKLDPVVVDRERVAGGGVFQEGEGQADKDFTPIDFDNLGIPALPDLPEPSRVWKRALPWLHSFYRQHGPGIRAVMDRLADRERPFSREA